MKWSSTDYNEHASYVSAYGQEVLDLLAPQPQEAILDLGCGDGTLAVQLQNLNCEVLAIDASQSMIDAAKSRDLSAICIDAKNINYQSRFDAVFSNAALHWMPDAQKVIQNVYSALKPGGRFCAEMGAAGNVETIVNAIYNQLAKLNIDAAALNPWFFPTKQQYKQMLEAGGFSVKYIDEFERPTPLPTDIAGWLTTFAKPFLQNLSDKQKTDAIAQIVSALTPILCDELGQWFADYKRLRFVAQKTKV